MQKKAARRGQRALAFLLCLLMVATLLPVMGASAAEGVGGNEVTNPTYTGADSGLVLSKTLTEDTNGNYSLKLEAYATGDVKTTPDTVAPMDIVLVLDQSGSMAENFGNSVQLKNADKMKGETAGYYIYSSGDTYYLVKYNASTKMWQRSSNGTNWSKISNLNTTVHVSRLGALKDAVTTFVNSIQENANEYNVDHRIAMIGFASKNYEYYNTELLTGVTIQEKSVNTIYSADDWSGYYLYPNAKRYIGASNPTNADYQNSLVNVRTNTESLTKAIDALTAHGGTQTNDGLKMAENVFDNNPLADSTSRKRVVVLFTDGDTDSDRSTTIQTAYSLKQANASVYTVGIFDGANPTLDQNRAGKANNFMHYLSSNYPNANSWDSPGTGTRPSTDKDDSFYLAASDADSLSNVFSTIQGSITGSSKVNLTTEAVLKDVVSDKFTVPANVALSAASYACTGKANDGSFTWSETASKTYTPVRDGQTVTVTGFDYKENYVAMLGDEPHGQKLVLTISGLIPKDSGEQVFSNTDVSGVYDNGTSETPVARFPMPSTNIPVYTKVLDFSMTANIATSVQQSSTATKNYGTFSTDDNGNLTYKLGTGVANGNLVFDGVDSVLFYGDYNDDGNDTAARWNKVNVIPANNVYYDDNLLSSSSTFTDGDQGYDSAVNSVTYGVDNLSANTTKTLTFTGTGIDVYCTTEKNSGSVYAKLRAVDAEGNVINSLVIDAAGNKVMDGSMNNTYVSNPSLINVPTLSFTGLTYGTYQLTIRTGNNENYKLDGVRIYNPANADAVAVGKESDIDVKAQFVNVREQLLSATPTGLTEGAVYVDEKHETNDISVYEKDGPKNEVYLAQNQKVGFQLTGVPEGATVLVGLSTPENQGSATAKVTCGEATTNLAVNSAIDMYYPVEVSSDGYVVIENTSNVLLSVTNVQISSGDGTSSAMVMSSPELMSYMADFDALTVVDTTPAPEAPTPETPNNTISAIIHAIWAQVRDSIGKLFGRL